MSTNIWLVISTLAVIVGVYYLLCAFLPEIRFMDGTWQFHLAPNAYFWMFPIRPRALRDRPVTRRSFLLTGGGFLAGGVAGILNYEGYINDDYLQYVLFAVVVISLIAILLDFLAAPS